jgi:HAMP domain-containing protein
VSAAIGARNYGDALDNAIDAGALTVNDVFDRQYVEVKGYGWGQKPKFHTRYDSYVENIVLVFQEKFMEQEDYLYAVGVDENGYLPAHNVKYQKPVTGDAPQDLTGNRTKRIFNDPVGLKAAQNQEPGFLQEYDRDNGDKAWDVSSPIYVKGKHWGGFRVGVLMDKISERQWGLVKRLAIVFFAFALITILGVFVIVNQAVKPVVALTHAAEQISMGEGLDQPIKADTEDEIGLLTKAVDRLRSSMKAAMTRLGQ